jgi:hypothetical protein
MQPFIYLFLTPNCHTTWSDTTYVQQHWHDGRSQSYFTSSSIFPRFLRFQPYLKQDRALTRSLHRSGHFRILDGGASKKKSTVIQNRNDRFAGTNHEEWLCSLIRSITCSYPFVPPQFLRFFISIWSISCCHSGRYPVVWIDLPPYFGRFIKWLKADIDYARLEFKSSITFLAV